MVELSCHIGGGNLFYFVQLLALPFIPLRSAYLRRKGKRS